MLIKARGVQHKEVCVRCGKASLGPYCTEHRPKHFDRRKPFWGGQGATRQQAKARKAYLVRHPTCELRLVCDGAPATQVDHVISQAQGGSDTEDNWAAACGPCNLSKGG